MNITRDMVHHVVQTIFDDIPAFGAFAETVGDKTMRPAIVADLFHSRLLEALKAHQTVSDFIDNDPDNAVPRGYPRKYTKREIDDLREAVAVDYTWKVGSMRGDATFWPTVEARLHVYLMNGITIEEFKGETS